MPEGEAVIAVLGVTGTGKSSFIKLLSNDANAVAGHGLSSETKEVVLSQLSRGGRSVTLIDTPGFDNTRESVTDLGVLQKIASFLTSQYEKGKKLTGVIFLHRISDPRLGAIARRNFRMFLQFCGFNSMGNVVIATTFWNLVPDQTGFSREKDLRSSDTAFKTFFDNGAQYMRHDDGLKSASAILDHLLSLEPNALLTQEEIRRGKSLIETAAAAELRGDLRVEAVVAEHEKEMKELQSKMEKALKDKDTAAQQLLEEDRKKSGGQNQGFQEEKRKLEESLRREAAVVKAQVDQQLQAERRRSEDLQRQLQTQTQRANTLQGQISLDSRFHPGSYILVNAKSGKAVDLSGSDSWSILCYSLHSGANQQWIFTRIGETNTFSIRDTYNSRYISYNYAQDNTRVVGSNNPTAWEITRAYAGLYRIGLPGTTLVFDHANYGESEFVNLHNVRSYYEPCQCWKVFLT